MTTILVIEDSTLQRRALKEALEGSGRFERVLEAEDGLGGLRILLSEPVDVVLCDLHLPGIDGEKLLRAKGGRQGRPEVPFLFVTANEDPERTARLLRDGASDVIAKPYHAPELLARLDLHLRIKQLQQRLRERNSELEQLSRTDPLTGLRTRRYLTEVMPLELVRSCRYRMPLSAWMADLDQFKRVNDCHGHRAGDTILRGFGEVVRRTLRATDVAARWGGEEFFVLLPHTDRKGALAAAERVRMVTEESEFPTPRGDTVQATVSIGVASLGPGIDSPETLLEAADEALYRAKQDGRNRVAAARIRTGDD